MWNVTRTVCSHSGRLILCVSFTFTRRQCERRTHRDVARGHWRSEWYFLFRCSTLHLLLFHRLHRGFFSLYANPWMVRVGLQHCAVRSVTCLPARFVWRVYLTDHLIFISLLCDCLTIVQPCTDTLNNKYIERFVFRYRCVLSQSTVPHRLCRDDQFYTRKRTRKIFTAIIAWQGHKLRMTRAKQSKWLNKFILFDFRLPACDASPPPLSPPFFPLPNTRKPFNRN